MFLCWIIFLLKKLSLDSNLVDQDKSYICFDSNTNNNIIELYLYKETDAYCDNCKSKNVVIRGSKITINKTPFPDANHVVVNVHRRIYKCCDCNHTFIQCNPLSLYGRKITVQKDVHILNALRDKSKTYSAIAKDFKVSVSYVINLFDKHVDLKRQSMPYVLCIDEVYAKKLVKNSYCCVLYAPQWRKIVDVLDSRHKLNLIDYLSRIPIEEKNKVQFISMYLWDSHRDVAKLCFPKAKVSADPFHVVKNLNKCFQDIRINTMKKYTYLKDKGSNYYWLFKKFWRFLLTDTTKLPDIPIRVSKSGSYMSKYKIIDCMLTVSDKLSKAYALKEEYRNFVATASIDTAENELDIIIEKFKNTHIPEYSSFIRIMNNWHDEIINSFNKINEHKITNGPTERINRDIKLIFGISFGSTNFTRVRNRIMFTLNEDSPIIASGKKTTNKKIGKPRGKYKK